MRLNPDIVSAHAFRQLCDFFFEDNTSNLMTDGKAARDLALCVYCHPGFRQNMKALGLVVSEKKIFLCFPHYKSIGANDPPVGPFLTPGAWLAGFIKRTTICCYLQNMKALGLVVSEKKIFLCFSHDAPRGGACMDPRGMVGRIYEEDHYTMLNTKYESSGPCDFREEAFFYVLPMTPPPPYMDPRGTVGRIYN